MSEDLAPPSLREALPTLLPKPNKGSGKGNGKGKTAKKSSKGTGKGGKWHEEFLMPLATVSAFARSFGGLGIAFGSVTPAALDQ